MSAIQGYVDKLGPTSSVDEQLEAARFLGRLRNEECIAAVAAGAIPLMVALLYAGTTTGAIPALVELLSTSTPASVQMQAAGALGHLNDQNPDNQRETVAAGAIPPHGGIAICCHYSSGNTVAACAIPLMVALLSADTTAGVQTAACYWLAILAVENPDHQRKLAAAGAIPALVELLSTSTPANVQLQAARALGHMNDENPDIQRETVAAADKNPQNTNELAEADAIPFLDALLVSDVSTEPHLKHFAQQLHTMASQGRRSDLELCRAREETEKEKARQATNDVAQDQISAVENQDADAHLVQEQQQPAGVSAECGGDAGEPSGIGTACLGGDEDHALSPSGSGDREPRGSGSATATAANQQAVALTAPLGSVGSAANSAPNTAAAAPTVTSAAVSASNALHATSTDTPTAATTTAASTPTSTTIPAAAAIATPTAGAASASDALPITSIDTPTTSVDASTPVFYLCSQHCIHFSLSFQRPAC
eukprot:gene9420-biopygen2873